MDDRLQWQLSPTARSAVQARRLIASTLGAWGFESLSDAAVLLTSELVTNSILHARTELTLVASREPGGVRIAVTDGSAVPPRRRSGSRTATTGRGIQLLDRIADAWNAEPHGAGKTVWFTLSRGRDPWAGYGAHDWLAEADG